MNVLMPLDAMSISDSLKSSPDIDQSRFPRAFIFHPLFTTFAVLSIACAE
ncbi:MAG: hypothetical protein HPY53_13360 [Brevinematales bacterium]|nr:hypothetical protein [Brevinematales bacterium]